jgi:hypothetical protein
VQAREGHVCSVPWRARALQSLYARALARPLGSGQPSYLAEAPADCLKSSGKGGKKDKQCCGRAPPGNTKEEERHSLNATNERSSSCGQESAESALPYGGPNVGQATERVGGKPHSDRRSAKENALVPETEAPRGEEKKNLRWEVSRRGVWERP